MGVNNVNNRAAYDPRVAQELRTQLNSKSPQSAKAAAAQFEAMFLQQVFKSMRDTVPQDGIISGGQGAQLYNGLLDQQMSQNISAAKGGVGFAKQIESQLARQMGADSKTYPAGSQVPKIDNEAMLQNLITNYKAGSARPFNMPVNTGPQVVNSTNNTLPPRVMPNSTPSASPAFNPTPAIINKPVDGSTPISANSPTGKLSPSAFAQNMLGYANQASEKTGIPAQFLVGHAALESGWGNSVPKAANGESSYNLFGIKAGSNWTGKTVDVVTTEYVDGQPQKMVQKFRAYDSYQDAFNDYASLLSNSSRYAKVIGTQDPAQFAWGLQKAGYATDPSYARKLAQVITSPRMNKAVSIAASEGAIKLASVETSTQSV